MDKRPITDLELKAIIDAEIKSAMGEDSSDLAGERSRSMDYYLGKAVGNLSVDNDDRSKAMLLNIHDAVEWILPQLMRMFCATDELATFEPTGQQDEESARDETEAINHLFWQKNPGFLILYSWMKDALLQKNGIITWYIEEEEHQSREEVDGVPDVILAEMMAQPGVEAVEHEPSQIATIGGQELHHVVFKRTQKRQKICIENLPPEEFLISTDARSVSIRSMPPRMVGYWTTKTVGELRDMGWSEAEVDEMKAGGDWQGMDEEFLSRYDLSDEQQSENSALAESQREIRIAIGWMDIDRNGDGYPELIRFWRAGDFLDIEEADDRPLAAITPNILTHKFYGESIGDALTDIQEIGTTIIRNVLDNMYQVNNVRPVANERVDVDSLLTSRPGAPIYIDDEGPVGDALMPFAPPAMWKDALSLLEFFKEQQKQRTGVGDEVMGLDPKALANANTGVVMEAMDAARAKIELIARIFAETGIKDLFRGLHDLCRRSHEQPISYRRGKEYRQTMPQQWCEREDVTINVGTAAGNTMRRLVALQRIGEIQGLMIQAGGLGVTVAPQHVYKTAYETAEAMGENGSDYFLDPRMLANPQVQQALQAQMPPPQQDPQSTALQLTAQVEQAKVQQRNRETQINAMLKQREIELKQQDMALKAQMDRMSAQLDTLRSAADNRTDMQKAAMQQQAKAAETELKAIQVDLEARQAAQQAAIDQYRAELQAFTSMASDSVRLAGEESRAAQTQGSLQASIARLEKQISSMTATLERKASENG